MFNPMFKEIDQGRKHPGSCAFAELELVSYRKPKRVVQNEKNGHEMPKIVITIIMKIMMKQNTVTEIVRGADDDTQNQNSTPQNSPIDCDGVQLTNAQWHMVPIVIIWYRESWIYNLNVYLKPNRKV